MHSRRRQTLPPFFNLSLLDVVCNALGAVIFLMFLSYWQANHVSRHLQASLAELGTKEFELKELLGRLAVTEQSLGETQKHLKLTEKALSETEQALQKATQSAAHLRLLLQGERTVRQGLEQELSLLRRQAQDLEKLAGDASAQLQQRERQLEAVVAELRKTINERDVLAKQLSLARADAAAQSKSLAQMLSDLSRQESLAAEYQHTLQVHRATISALERQRQQLDKNYASALARARELETQLATTQTAQKVLEEKISDLQKSVHDLTNRLNILRKENLRLSDQLVQAQGRVGDELRARKQLEEMLQQIQRRFAGVELSGQRVVFLVDTSGSMGKSDPLTDDPTKWRRVCETVRHVMLSMPNLQEFDLITFASEVHYPLGEPGQWRKFDRDKSHLDVYEKLLKLKPEGGTNLHLAFEETFRKYGGKHLDTIFLFSDGLPTESPDLTPEESRLGNQERERLLAPRLLKHIEDWQSKATQRVCIHAIGFYYDSPNLGNFLWSLALRNGGSFVGMSQRQHEFSGH